MQIRRASLGQSLSLTSPGIITADSPGIQTLPELAGYFCTYRVDKSLEEFKASMCLLLASTKTFGADRKGRLAFGLTPPWQTSLPSLACTAKGLSGRFLERPAAWHPHSHFGLPHGSTEIPPATGKSQSSLCFELGLPKGNSQGGFQPNHPLLTALFFYAGCCGHRGGFPPRIPVSRKLLAREK